MTESAARPFKVLRIGAFIKYEMSITFNVASFEFVNTKFVSLASTELSE